LVLSLPFILAFIGSAVALIIGMVIYGDISDAIECPVGGVGGGGGGPISEFFNTLGLEQTIPNNVNLALNFATNGDVGQLVTLSGQQIHSVRIENINLESVDIGHLTAKIWSDVIVGQHTKIEEARSETLSLEDIEALVVDLDDFDYTFNFTTTPLLSGSDIVIGLSYYFDDNAHFPLINPNPGSVLFDQLSLFDDLYLLFDSTPQRKNLGLIIPYNDTSISQITVRIGSTGITTGSLGTLKAVIYSGVEPENIGAGDAIHTVLASSVETFEAPWPASFVTGPVCCFEHIFTFDPPVAVSGPNIAVTIEATDIVDAIYMVYAFGGANPAKLCVERTEDDEEFYPCAYEVSMKIESDQGNEVILGGNEGVLVASYGGFNTIGQDCGGSCNFSDMNSFRFLGQLITLSDQSAYSLRFEDIDSTLTNAGKLRAVVYSNVVEGEGISNSTLEATSDFIDLSDPQYAFNSDIDITFNFTTPVYLTGIDDIFIGLNSYDKSPNESITAPNAGTFGSSADGIYFVNNIETNFVDITGIINQGVRQGSGGQESEIRYDFDGTSAWNFLHTLSGDNKTSINFWVRGDIDQPDSVTLIDTTGGSNNGFVLYTDTGEINLYLLEESTEIIYGIFSLGIPPDDSNWHLISLMMDKGNTTNFAKLCIDGSTNCQSLNIDNQFSGSGSDADYTLTIGSSHFTSTEFEFDVDDVTVWNGYTLTNADIDTLWNGGTGSSAGSTGSNISPSTQVLHVTFDDLTGASGPLYVGVSPFTFGPPHGENIYMINASNWTTNAPYDPSSPQAPNNAVDTKMEFIVLSDWETDPLSNNFVDMAMQVMSSQGGGGGQGGIGSEQCQQAKDISWTVIGIIPVALFFFLFAIFSALGTGRQ